MHYFTIQTQSKVPLYIQLVDSIKLAIEANHLRHLDPLPTESQIAMMFHISPIVVKQAYQRLKDMHLIISIKGKGSFVFIRDHHDFDYALFTPMMFKKFESFPWTYIGVQKAQEILQLQFRQPSPFPVLMLKKTAAEGSFPILYQRLYFRGETFTQNAHVNPHTSVQTLLSSLYPLDHWQLSMRYQPEQATESVALALAISKHDPVHTWRILFKVEGELQGIGYYHFPAAFISLKRED